MAVFKCKMCGGELEIAAGESVAECEYCGSKQTLPRMDSERKANLYDRANHFRRNNEFDKAADIYEQILNEDTTDAEAYWSLVLCRYGVEYVEDPATHRRVPTVNRTQYTSIFADENYKKAIECADALQRELYEAEARAIDEIQRGILEISEKEDPFDVFICYKETDAQGRRTPDSVLANELYHELTKEGFKVFFSRITLEDKLGTAYEPYIFAALNSARVMVVLGTKQEYFNAVWVKNEWSRYLALIRSGAKKTLIPAYRDMDPYDLPEEFSHLQAQDMSKLGFMPDLIRGVKKLLQKDEPKPTPAQTVVREVVQGAGGANIAPLLRRAFMYLEDGEWQSADEYCEKVLDQEPENAQAYLGKLMAEMRARRQTDLPNCEQPFDHSNNYQKAIRFGDEGLSTALRGYVEHINERNENARLTGIYNNAVSAMHSANTESAYKAAAIAFKTIPSFKDADALAKQCIEAAEVCRKDAVYSSAKAQMTGERTDGYEAAIKAFSTVSGWKDSDEQIIACQRKIEEIRAKKEAERLERERAAKKRKRTIAIVTPIVIVCIALVIVLITVIIPNGKYNAAIDLYNAGKYEEAITAFTAMNGYKDSSSQIEKCESAIKDGIYDEAMALIDSGNYESGYALLKEIGNSEAIASSKYDRAVALIDSGDYEAGYALLKEIGNSDAIALSKYDRAVAFIDSGDYEAAYLLLNGLDYNDSAEVLDSIKPEYKKALLMKAQVGSFVFFGEYEQDGLTSNGKEDIEWLVLAKEEDRILVISRYALDCQKFDAPYTDGTWKSCSLRYWLNNTFINSAFNSNEKSMIPIITVTADINPQCDTSPGEDTRDRVFLLSVLEVEQFFSFGMKRGCKPTAYTIAKGCDVNSYDGTCWWWLRSPGWASTNAAVVQSNAVLYPGNGVSCEGGAVRPSLWISLES